MAEVEETNVLFVGVDTLGPALAKGEVESGIDDTDALGDPAGNAVVDKTLLPFVTGGE